MWSLAQWKRLDLEAEDLDSDPNSETCDNTGEICLIILDISFLIYEMRESEDGS